jgi:hypothetical protein
MKWFAVKTLCRTWPSGRPRARDRSYTPGLAAIEERIVLIRAKDGPSAIRKGLREAERYAKGPRTTNVYGQRISTEVLRFAQSYELSDQPADGVEVFSAIEIVSSRESASATIRRKAGRSSGPEVLPVFVAGFITTRLRAAGAIV